MTQTAGTGRKFIEGYRYKSLSVYELGVLLFLRKRTLFYVEFAQLIQRAGVLAQVHRR